MHLSTKSRSSRRTIELLDVTIGLLRGHRARQLEERMAAGPQWVDQDLVFTTIFAGVPQDSRLHEAWTKAREAAGLPEQMRRHDLRHAYATISLQAGGTLLETAKHLGHANANLVTSTYGHVQPSLRSLATARMNALLEAQ